MKKMLFGLTGLLIVILVTAFTLGSPDGGKEKKKEKGGGKTECVSTQSQSGCPGHAAMKASCDQTKCQGTCDPAKCQCTCDPAKCKEGCSCSCANGTCDPAKCEKHAAMSKK